MHGQAPCFGARREGRASAWAGGALRPALIVVLLASLALSACAGKKPQPEELPPLGPPVAVQESPEFFVANLAPRPMMKGKYVSEGMIFAADTADGGCSIAFYGDDTPVGSRIH